MGGIHLHIIMRFIFLLIQTFLAYPMSHYFVLCSFYGDEMFTNDSLVYVLDSDFLCTLHNDWSFLLCRFQGLGILSWETDQVQRKAVTKGRVNMKWLFKFNIHSIFSSGLSTKSYFLMVSALYFTAMLGVIFTPRKSYLKKTTTTEEWARMLCTEQEWRFRNGTFKDPMNHMIVLWYPVRISDVFFMVVHSFCTVKNRNLHFIPCSAWI